MTVSNRFVAFDGINEHEDNNDENENHELVLVPRPLPTQRPLPDVKYADAVAAAGGAQGLAQGGAAAQRGAPGLSPGGAQGVAQGGAAASAGVSPGEFQQLRLDVNMLADDHAAVTRAAVDSGFFILSTYLAREGRTRTGLEPDLELN